MKRKAELELTVVEQRFIELLKEVELRTGWVRSQTLTALAALLISAMVCATSVLIAAGEAPAALQSPTFSPLPNTTVATALTALQGAGFKVSNAMTLKVPSGLWGASQGMKFILRQENCSGTFILLGYPSAEPIGADVLQTLNDKAYRSWRFVQSANLPLLAAPETPAELGDAAFDRLNQVSVAPYREFLLTKTP